MLKRFLTFCAAAVVSLCSFAAEVVDVYNDYSTWTEWKLYEMGYTPTIENGVLTSQNDGWYQYFLMPAFKAEAGKTYNVTFKVRGSEPGNVSVACRWSWSEDAISAPVAITTEWNEVTVAYEEVGGENIDLIFQGVYAGKLEWASIKVTHDDAAAPAPEPAWMTIPSEAWSKIDRGEPTVMTANADGEYVVNATAKVEQPWDNQFWIAIPEALANGTKCLVSFDYKAEKASTSIGTQDHKAPGDYLGNAGVGGVTFTTDWQSLEKKIAMKADMKSIAFNLNDFEEANTYYFKNIIWKKAVTALEIGTNYSADNSSCEISATPTQEGTMLYWTDEENGEPQGMFEDGKASVAYTTGKGEGVQVWNIYVYEVKVDPETYEMGEVVAFGFEQLHLAPQIDIEPMPGDAADNAIALEDGSITIAADKVGRDEANVTHFTYTASEAGTFVFQCNPDVKNVEGLGEVEEVTIGTRGVKYGKTVNAGDVVTFTAILPESFVGVDDETYDIDEYYIFAGVEPTGTEPEPLVLDGGDFYVKNVETGLFLNGANSWGTKASVVNYGQLMTVAKLEDGTYTLDSHITNGGDKHFLGDNAFVDSPAAAYAIEAVEGGAYTIAFGDKYLAYQEVDGQKQANFVEGDVTDAAKWIFVTKEALIADANSATAENPVELTSLIYDSNFSRNNTYFSEWTAEVGTAPGKGGDNTNMNAEKWGGNSQEFNISQTLTGLPNGTYKLTVQGFYRYNNTGVNTNDNAVAAHADGTEVISSVLYANEVEQPLVSIADEASVELNGGAMPFSQGEASAAFGKGAYATSLIVKVTDGTLKIGVKKDNHPTYIDEEGNEKTVCDWTVWDNVQLFCLGVDGGAIEVAELEIDSEYNDDYSQWVATVAPTNEGNAVYYSLFGGEDDPEFQLYEGPVTLVWIEGMADEFGICKYEVLFQERDANDNLVAEGFEEVSLAKPIEPETLLVNGDFADGKEGWTITAEGGAWSDVLCDEPKIIEAYAGWGSLDLTDFNISQKVNLPAGIYKLSAYAFYRYGVSYDVDPAKSCAKLFAGDNEIEVATLASVPADEYANDVNAASAAFAAGNYLNELTFTVNEATEIEVGIKGAHELKQSWFITGPFELIQIASIPDVPTPAAGAGESIDNPIVLVPNTNVSNWTYVVGSANVGKDADTYTHFQYVAEKAGKFVITCAPTEAEYVLEDGTELEVIDYSGKKVYACTVEEGDVVQIKAILPTQFKGIDKNYAIEEYMFYAAVYAKFNLTADMFCRWDGFGADANIVSNNAGEYHIGESSGLPYGHGNVEGSAYADLTGYTTLALTVTEGAPRLLLNRQGMDNSGDFIEINPNKGMEYVTIDGNVWYINVAKITAEAGYCHLNCIKGANWANCTITEAILYVDEVNNVKTNPATAISEIASIAKAAGIYTINGVKAATLQKGLNIVIDENGNAKKVYIK